MDRTIEAFAAAQRIINTLERNGIDPLNADDIIDNVYFSIIDNLVCNYGGSRVVVWDDECDYVIKIARNGYYEKYCQREVEIYEAAIEEGLEENFGWCKCYIEPTEESVGIYVMEFLDGTEDDIYDSAWSFGYEQYCNEKGLDAFSEEIRKEYSDSYDYEDDERVLIDFFKSRINNFKLVTALDRFISKWQITDIHEGNILFRNGRMVICDYAGWGW